MGPAGGEPGSPHGDLELAEDAGQEAFEAAVSPDLERRAGRYQAAAVAYRRALDLVTNPAERAYLAHRLADVTDGTVG